MVAKSARLGTWSFELGSRAQRTADLLAPLGLIVAALPMRLANIGTHSGKGDEGTRAEQLLLMTAGFRPVRDIFASQGPLSLDIFYPFFVLSGGTLAGARLAVVVYSILGLLAVYWLGRLAAGRVGGFFAAGLLLLSPTYLKNSRLALVEIPALLPAALALGAALVYQRDGGRRWLVASAAALALALAIKPMMLPVIPAIGLALLLRRVPSPKSQVPSPKSHGRTVHLGLGTWDSGLGTLVLYGSIVAGLLGAIVLAVGPAELYEQLVRYRVGSRTAEGWSLAENWAMIWSELRWDGAAFFALATVGGAILLVAHPRVGLPLVAWTIATLGLLLLYSPLGAKHAAILPPPAALLAGAGLGWAWRLARGVPSPKSQVPSEGSSLGTWDFGLGTRALVGLAALGFVAYLISLPSVLPRVQQAMTEGDLGVEQPYREESALIQTLTRPDEFILVDDAYLAFLNRRLMPPRLVDTSIFLIRSGALSGTDVVDQAEAFDVRLMLLLSDNLREIKKFRDWADERFLVVKINERPNRKDRALYLRADADVEQARAAIRRVTPDLHPIDGELAGQVRVRGFALEQPDARSGGSTSLTVEWESVAPTAVDWRPVTFLRDRDGKVVDQTERSLGGGSGGTSTWTPGRWVFRTSTLQVPPRTPPGEYTVGVGLYDSRARRMATVTAGSGTGGEEIRLGSLRVR